MTIVVVLVVIVMVAVVLIAMAITSNITWQSVSLLVLLIRSLPEAEEVRSRLDVNSESVMDKSALNDDQHELTESSSGVNC